MENFTEGDKVSPFWKVSFWKKVIGSFDEEEL